MCAAVVVPCLLLSLQALGACMDAWQPVCVRQRQLMWDMSAPVTCLLHVLRALCCAVLSVAARHVESEGVQGSCTACLLTINKDTGRLQAATLGDSGFLIVGPRAPQHGDLEVRATAAITAVATAAAAAWKGSGRGGGCDEYGLSMQPDARRALLCSQQQGSQSVAVCVFPAAPNPCARVASLSLFSVMCVLSQMAVKFRTPQLEHEFGCPYQLGHHRYANSPCDADLAALPVTSGDVVVMGSDGLLDNMSETEVVNEVSKLIAAGAKPGAMAQRIAKVGGADGWTRSVVLQAAVCCGHTALKCSWGCASGATCVLYRNTYVTQRVWCGVG